MRLSLRAVLGLAAVACLSLGTAYSNGFYSPVALAAAGVAAALAIAAEAAASRGFTLPRQSGRELGLLALTLAVAAASFLAERGDEWFRLQELHGWLEPRTVRLTVAVTVALLVALALAFPKAEYASFDLLWAAAIAILLAGQSVRYARLLYPDGPPAAYAIVPLLGLVGFAAVVLLALWQGQPGARSAGCVLGLALLASGVGERACAVVASPTPIIDVFPLLTEGAGHLLAGHNPYTQDYTDPYADPASSRYGLWLRDVPETRPAGYPPLPFLAMAPFKAAGIDVRYACVLGDALAALVLFLAARRRGCGTAGLFLAAAYLHFPRAVMVAEQTWYEPILAALIGGGLYLSESPGWPGWVGRSLLALGLTGKQYGAVMLVPVLVAFRRDGQWWKFGIALATVVTLAVLPFLVWSPRDFIDIVVKKHTEKPPQRGSLTFTEGYLDTLEDRGFKPAVPPKWLMYGIAAALIAAASRFTPARPTAAALTTGTALLLFSLCYTQGYLNYFYLTGYLWLLGVAGGWDGGGKAAAPAPA